MKKPPENRLEEHVAEWLEDNSTGYLSIGEDLLQYGCQSGMVSHLIYYNDTTKFYADYQQEINDLLVEALESTGLTVNGLFGDKWDIEDPLANGSFNQNLLAWFGFEESARKLIEEW